MNKKDLINEKNQPKNIKMMTETLNSNHLSQQR